MKSMKDIGNAIDLELIIQQERFKETFNLIFYLVGNDIILVQTS